MAITACLLWSTAFVGIKTGLQYTTPMRFAGLRFILAGLFVLPFCGNIVNSAVKIWIHKRTIVLIGFFQTFLLYAFFYAGIDRVPASITAMVIGAGPLFIAILAHFMMSSDKITLKKLISIITGVAGVVIIAMGRQQDGRYATTELLGIGFLLLSNIAGGVGNVLISRNISEISPLLLNSAQILIGGLCLFLLSLPFEGIGFRVNPLPYYVSLAWLSFLSAAAFSIWFILLRRPGVKVSELNIWKFIIPVFGAILAWVLLPDENPQMVSVIGMGVIALSVILFNKQS